MTDGFVPCGEVFQKNARDYRTSTPASFDGFGPNALLEKEEPNRSERRIRLPFQVNSCNLHPACDIRDRKGASGLRL